MGGQGKEEDTGAACCTNAGKTEMRTIIWWENLKERNWWENQEMEGENNTKRGIKVTKVEDVVVLIWLGKRTSGGPLW